MNRTFGQNRRTCLQFSEDGGIPDCASPGHAFEIDVQTIDRILGRDMNLVARPDLDRFREREKHNISMGHIVLVLPAGVVFEDGLAVQGEPNPLDQAEAGAVVDCLKFQFPGME